YTRRGRGAPPGGLGEPRGVEERGVEKRGSPAERRYRSRRPGGARVKDLAREYNRSPVAVYQIVRRYGPAGPASSAGWSAFRIQPARRWSQPFATVALDHLDRQAMPFIPASRV